MKKILFSHLFFAGLLLSGCDQSSNKEVGDVQNDSIPPDKTSVATPIPIDTSEIMQKGDIKIYPLKGSPEFSDASIEMNVPEENSKLKESEEVTFSYEIKNYKLKGTQTPNESCTQCNNSKDGQHIHLILNNEPYIAVYEPTYKKKLEDGHYVALSFLSRSFHESIKNFQAYDLRQFTVGNVKSKDIDLSKPHLFYSRPKGEYKGESVKKVLLDFYLIGTELSSDGNKVRVVINDNEFLIDKWQGYIIEGLPMGETKIKLELIDKDGKLIKGPFNSVERTITLKQEAS
jgi:hypothetical protein